MPVGRPAGHGGPPAEGGTMRKILIVIDMQNDFIDGALGTPEA